MPFSPAADSSSTLMLAQRTSPSRTQRYLELVNRRPFHYSRLGGDHRVDHRAGLYAALLRSRVYVRDVELILGVDGPFREFAPSYDRLGPVLDVYTSRDRIPDGADAEGMSFRSALRSIRPGVRIRIDRDHVGHVISLRELTMLRKIAFQLQ
jgi:hypothetical protein